MLISEARAAMKGSIIAECIALGDVTTGTSEKGSWTKQTATLKDKSSVMQVTLWGEEIGHLDLHHFYKIENPWWKDYKGDTQLALGQYCTLHPAIIEDLLDSDGTAETVTETPSTPAQAIPAINENLVDFVTSETMVMLQIEQVVVATMTKFRPNNVESLPPAKIGMIVKEIYREARKTNLIKATHL